MSPLLSRTVARIWALDMYVQNEANAENTGNYSDSLRLCCISFGNKG